MAQLITATQVVDHLQSLGDQRQARHLMRFFKCEPGAYGHGDKFLGIKVPETRKVAKQCKALTLSEVARLLDSEWHEVRLCGLLVLVAQFEAQCTNRVLDNADATARRDAIVEFYLEHARSASNWDLVDLSVYKILGRWLMVPSRYSVGAAHVDSVHYGTSATRRAILHAAICRVAPASPTRLDAQGGGMAAA